MHPSKVKELAEAVGLLTWPSFLHRVGEVRAEKYFNGGWRGTKTISADLALLTYIIPTFIMTPGTHLVWLIGPDYEQARPDYFNIENWCRDKLLMQVTSSEAQQGGLNMVIQKPGLPGIIEISTKSAAHPQTLGSVGPKFILACEAGQMSEQARDRIRGRASTYNCPIIWNGTFENDEGKPQYSWFEEESKLYSKNPTPRRKAYSLPIWENLGLFADCREMVEDDPTLKAFCPDDNHGPAHSGIDPNHPDLIPGTSGVPLHPKIRELYEECRDKPTFWRKYYAGEPVGILNPVYEWANVAPENYLRRMSDELRNPAYRWIRSAGGVDFGLGPTHLSALVVGSIDQEGNTWIRRCESNDQGNMNWVWSTAERWSAQYRIPSDMWGLDPQVKYNPSKLQGRAMSGGLYSREARVGVVEGARLNEFGEPRLFFDSGDPGVVLLFGEVQRVHMTRKANGQYGYDRREGEDRVAAFEDLMAMLHGQYLFHMPRKVSIPRRAKKAFSRQLTGTSVA